MRLTRDCSPLANSISFCITPPQTAAPVPSRSRQLRGTTFISVRMANQLAAQCRFPDTRGFGCSRSIEAHFARSRTEENRGSSAGVAQLHFSKRNEDNAKRIGFHSPSGQEGYVASACVIRGRNDRNPATCAAFRKVDAALPCSHRGCAGRRIRIRGNVQPRGCKKGRKVCDAL